MFLKWLLLSSSFLPIAPQLNTHKSLCKESLWGVPFPVQSTKLVPVYKQDGSLQCEKERKTINHMKRELQSMGVKVYKSSRGKILSRNLAVCGAPTSQVNIYYIPAYSYSKVKEHGYHLCAPSDKRNIANLTSLPKRKLQSAQRQKIESLRKKTLLNSCIYSLCV